MNIAACLAIAMMFAFAPAYAQDEAAQEKAEVKSLQKLAVAGDAQAQFDLGMAYHDGDGGLKQSDAKAVEWFERAANQHEVRAEYNLGIAYYNGLGTKKNVNEAIKWFKLAAEQNQPDAQFILAAAYDKGMGGLTQDIVMAYVWLSRASDGGNEEAKRELPDMEKKLNVEERKYAKKILAEKKLK